MTRFVWSIFFLAGCPGSSTPTDSDPPPIDDDACDAGDEAWVQRALPLVVGRKALGAGEVRAWVTVVEQHGRNAALAGMMRTPGFTSHWRDWLTDALAVARTGDKAYQECFRTPLMPDHDGSLSQHIRSSETPWISPFEQTFNMADVINDALVADDLAVIWQANLYARVARPVGGANVSETELEYNRRVNFGEAFFETYLNRNLSCVNCHNSTFSVTDHPDPALDRTWQLPGRHETAVLGDNVDYDTDALFSMFRYSALQGGMRRAWGMSQECGVLRGPNGVPSNDFLGQNQSYFVQPYDGSGSVWQMERMLSRGASTLSTDGLVIGENGFVDGESSYAYLLGARISDLAFESATGGRLTIAHGFPRNQAQSERLERITNAFVESGFSLETLLQQVTSDDLFNPALTDTCPSTTYGLPPVVNPWSVEEDDVALQNNSVGDLVHRLPSRVLQRTAQVHIGRSGIPGRWELSETERDFQASVGTFLRESQPGFNGVDFAGMLAFENRYGTCGQVGADDWVSALYAARTDFRRRDVAEALKDRLFANSEIRPVEANLIASILGPFDESAEELDEADLRLVCGAMMMSAPYQLVLTPEPTAPPPILAVSTQMRCEQLQPRMEDVGFPVTCP